MLRPYGLCIRPRRFVYIFCFKIAGSYPRLYFRFSYVSFEFASFVLVSQHSSWECNKHKTSLEMLTELSFNDSHFAFFICGTLTAVILVQFSSNLDKM